MNNNLPAKETLIIKNVYRKILKVYPFLTKKERNTFEGKATPILKGKTSEGLKAEKIIQKILRLFNNAHADIKKLKRINTRKDKKRYSPSFRIENRILVIKIPSWIRRLGDISKRLINACLKNIDKYDGIIIDVRENGGGSSKIAHAFAGIFFNKVTVYGKFIKRMPSGRLKTIIGKISPHKETLIDKPIVILVSKGCFSSTELFLAPFKVSKRAILIGEKTGGGSGCPTRKIIKTSGKKFLVRIPTWRFFLKGGNKPIEETKINPDITYTKKNIEEFARECLLKHHKLIRSKQNKF